MKRILLSVAIVLAVSACGGDADETTTITDPPTGMAAVDACIAVINAETASMDLNADGAEDQLADTFGVEGPAACSFFWADDPAALVGVTDAELMEAILGGLDPDLINYLGTPSFEQFEETADEL